MDNITEAIKQVNEISKDLKTKALILSKQDEDQAKNLGKIVKKFKSEARDLQDELRSQESYRVLKYLDNERHKSKKYKSGEKFTLIEELQEMIKKLDALHNDLFDVKYSKGEQRRNISKNLSK